MPRYKYAIGGAVIVIVLLVVYYGRLWGNLENSAINLWGDGYKNYYTLAYYVKFNSGSHFTGMNYPYGENIIYTDNQPLLAFFLKGISKVFPGITNHLRQTIYIIWLASIVLSYLILFRLFRVLKLPPPHAVAFAVFIAMLAPQIQRMNGQYSLTYSFFVPLLILYCYQFTEQNKAKHIVQLTILLAAFTFLHPYYFAIGAMFLASLAVLQSVQNKTLKPFALLVPVVIAFVVFKGYTYFTDNATDRVAAPWGFIESKCGIADLLLNQNSIVYHALCKAQLTGGIRFSIEGESYMGLVVIAVLIALPVICFKSSFNNVRPPRLLLIFLLASIPCLLFAMAFPFSINRQTANWLKHMPYYITQFRAVNRFVWIFYYCSSIIAAVTLSGIFQQIKKPIWRVMAFFAIAVIWFIDVNATANYWAKGLQDSSKPTFERKECDYLILALNKHGLKYTDFQAILPVPLFHVGSEKLGQLSGMYLESMGWSLDSGLPIIGSMMSRTSVSQTLSIANLFSGPLIEKNALEQFKNAKPLLVVKGNGCSVAEERLIKKAEFLFEAYGNKIYSLPITAFTDSLKFYRQNLAVVTNGYFKHGGYSSDCETDNVVINSFAAGHRTTFGNQSGHFAPENNTIFAGKLPHATDSTLYEISYWLQTDLRTSGYPALSLSITDPENKLYSRQTLSVQPFPESYGKWVRVSSQFLLVRSIDSIILQTTDKPVVIDELMIKPCYTSVMVPFEQGYMFNGYYIRP